MVLHDLASFISGLLNNKKTLEEAIGREKIGIKPLKKLMVDWGTHTSTLKELRATSGNRTAFVFLLEPYIGTSLVRKFLQPQNIGNANTEIAANSMISTGSLLSDLLDMMKPVYLKNDNKSFFGALFQGSTYRNGNGKLVTSFKWTDDGYFAHESLIDNEGNFVQPDTLKQAQCMYQEFINKVLNKVPTKFAVIATTVATAACAGASLFFTTVGLPAMSITTLIGMLEISVGAWFVHYLPGEVKTFMETGPSIVGKEPDLDARTYRQIQTKLKTFLARLRLQQHDTVPVQPIPLGPLTFLVKLMILRPKLRRNVGIETVKDVMTLVLKQYRSNLNNHIKKSNHTNKSNHKNLKAQKSTMNTPATPELFIT